jgi:HlyD family secretion protein
MTKWIVIVLVLLLAGGGAYYWWVYRGDDKADAPAVITAKVERGPIRLIVASTGRVVSNLDVDIKCKASGEVKKLPFDVSDTVKKGNLLVELDPVDEDRVLKQAEVALDASQAGLAMARQSLVVAERTLVTDRAKAEAALKSVESRAADARAKADRVKTLFDKNLASREETDTAETTAVQAAADMETARVKIEELNTQEQAIELKRQEVKGAEAQVESDKVRYSIAQDRLRDTKVMAPMDGVVASRNVELGQIISSAISNVGGGTTVLTLSDLSRVFVLVSVDESDIGKVQLGQKAVVTADAYPGKFFDGKVVRIATRGVNLSNVVTFEVKMEVIAEAKSMLKPEMTANVEITAAEMDDTLLVPAEAVVRKARGKKFVTVVSDDGTKEEVPVEIGISDGTKTEITKGLDVGQTVVDYKGQSDSKWSGGQKSGGGPKMGMFAGGGPRKG